MKLFIWYSAKRTTDSYHDEAGVVVVAKSLEDARAIFLSKQERTYMTTEVSQVMIHEPDEVHDLFELDGNCWIFPDAGCC